MHQSASAPAATEQAGLSWSTILAKRQAYRTAFEGFDPAKVTPRVCWCARRSAQPRVDNSNRAHTTTGLDTARHPKHVLGHLKQPAPCSRMHKAVRCVHAMPHSTAVVPAAVACFGGPRPAAASTAHPSMQVAAFDDARLAALMEPDAPPVVRHRGKLASAVQNAR